MPKSKDEVAAALAVEKGYVTPEQVETALRDQLKMREEMDIEQPLLRVFIGKRWLTPDQAQDLRHAVAVKSGEARLVAGYEIISRIGQGGMGSVFKARKLDTDELVALKILPPSLADEKMIARFKRESEIVRDLDHDNIVRCVEFGFDQRRKCHFCALELVDGEDLHERIKRLGKLTEDEAVSIAYQIAMALQHAHYTGLVHRDVKPENIMVTRDGTAKLLDLGLARPAKTEVTRVTQSGMFVGSPYYASPEQAGGSQELDIRSDIYSLGATLYHMVTGKPPFEGTSVMAILQKHIKEELPWPADVNPEVSDAVCLIISKMMAKDPAGRYQIPNDFLADLELLIEGRQPSVVIVAPQKSSIAPASRPRTGAPRLPSPDRLRKSRKRRARRKRRASGEAVRPERRARKKHETTKGGSTAAVAQGRETKPHDAKKLSARAKLAAVAGAAALVAVALAAALAVTSSRPSPAPSDSTGDASAGGEAASGSGPAAPPALATAGGPASRSPAAAAKKPAKAKPTGKPARKPGKRERAAAALRAAEAHETRHPKDFEGIASRYRKIVADFPGTRQAREAEVNLIRLRSIVEGPPPEPPSEPKRAATPPGGAAKVAPAASPSESTGGAARGDDGSAAQPAGAKAIAMSPEAAALLEERLARFEALVAKGKLDEARTFLVGELGAKKNRPIAHGLRAAARVAISLQERRDAVRRAAGKLKGTDAEIRTAKGKLRGGVRDVSGKGIAMTVRISDRGGRLLGETRMTVKWGELAPDQEDEFARSGGWAPSGVDGAAATALVALGRGEVGRARAALGAAGPAARGHALAAHIRARMAGTASPAKAGAPSSGQPASKEPGRGVRAPKSAGAGEPEPGPGKPKWPPDVAAVRKLFAGEVRGWNPKALAVELYYDFEDPAQAADWSLAGGGGGIEVKDGALGLSGCYGAALLKARFGAVTARTEFAVKKGEPNASIVVCADGKGNDYRMCGVGEDSDGVLSMFIGKREDGAHSYLTAPRGSPFADSPRGTLSLSFTVGRLKGRAGKLAVAVNDKAHSSGRAGVQARRCDATFDSFHLTGVFDPAWLRKALEPAAE